MRARVRNITLVSKIRKKKKKETNTYDKNKNLSRYFNMEKLWFFEIQITQGRDWNYFTFTALCNVAARTETQCTSGYKPEIANWENSNVYRVLISSLLDTRNKTVRSPRIIYEARPQNLGTVQSYLRGLLISQQFFHTRHMKTEFFSIQILSFFN